MRDALISQPLRQTNEVRRHGGKRPGNPVLLSLVVQPPDRNDRGPFVHVDGRATYIDEVHASSSPTSVRQGRDAQGKTSFPIVLERQQCRVLKGGVRDYILVRAGVAPKINSLAPLPT